MKKQRMKKAAAAILSGVLAAGLLSGCGGSAQKTSSTTEDLTNKPDTWIADRTINVQVYVNDIGYSLPKDLDNTPLMQEITKRTGIKLNIQYTPGDNDSKVLASQLASGTIPDVIVSYLNDSTRPEFPILLKAAKEGMFADVSSYIKDSKVYSNYLKDGYLTNDMKTNISFREDFNGAAYLMQLGIDKVDNSTKWIPETEYLGGMYIQKAIADQLGVDPTKIQTGDEFYDLLKQIKAGGFKDDNGNDVWPLGPKYWGGTIDALTNWVGRSYNWGVSGSYNLDENGNVKHEAETDHIYEKINFARKLIQEGLMNPEFFTMDTTRAKEVSEIGNSAIIADVHNYQKIIYSSDKWVPLGPLNTIAGDNKLITHGKTANGVWAISAKAENPDQIFRFFDYLSTPEGQIMSQYGVENVSYTIKDGKPRLTEEVQKHLDDGDTDWLVNEVGAGFGGSGNLFFDFMLTNLAPMEYFGESRPGAGESPTFERSVKIAETYPREKRLIPGLDASAYMTAPELADVKAQMDLLKYDDVLVQAIFAKDDAQVKSIVESFRAQLKSAGVEKFEEYVKKVYDEDHTAVNFFQ